MKSTKSLAKKFDKYCEKKSGLSGECAPDGRISCVKCEARWYNRTELLKEVKELIFEIKRNMVMSKCPTTQWCEGYNQACQDMESKLKQLEKKG